MSEQNTSTENSNSKPSSTTQVPIRFRSRFPRAQPNIAISSGIARIRRISGHYTSNEQETAVNSSAETTPSTPPVPQPSSPLPRQLIESVLSPKINNNLEETSSPRKNLNSDLSDQLSKTPPVSTSLTFRQLISHQISTSPANHILHSVSQPGTPIILIPDQTNASHDHKFSKEHIMNIIKYKAMQKLKKIESENLKEKRKKNKRNSILFNNKLLTKSSSATNLLLNENEVANVVDLNQIDRSKLRMRDFLYYNPRLMGKKKLDTNKNGNELEQTSSNEIIIENNINRSSSSISFAIQNSENETTNDTTLSESLSSKSSEPVVSKKIAAPQLKISEDGTIVINEESLVIQREHHEPVYDSTVVEGEQVDNLTYNSYRKFHHTKKWTSKETAKFYKALSMVGTDFTMIQKFFPHRNRDEIKRKFKREEKINQAFIDKILSKTAKIDLSIFVSSSSDEDGDRASQKSTSTNNGNKKNKKLEKENDGLNSTDQDLQSKKKAKLKRIQKRAFIESESDNEINSKVNKKQSLVKSKQFISDSESNKEDFEKIENSSQIDLKTDSNSNSNLILLEKPMLINEIVIQEQIVNIENKTTENEEIKKTESNSQLIQDSNQFVTEQEEEKDEEEEEEDGIELIFDLDNNTIIRQNDSEQQQTGAKSGITITKVSNSDKSQE